MESRFTIPAPKQGVQRVEMQVKMCFKCGKEKKIVPGHKVCIDCHVPAKCHTCNPKSVVPVSNVKKLT